MSSFEATERAPGGVPVSTRLPVTGEAVGEYRILAELGRGSMGAVYRASDPAGREVALKLLTPENTDPVGLERFQREGRALAALPPHLNLLRVHAMGVHQGLPWIALELVEGDSLLARISAHGPLPTAEAVTLVRKLCLVLEQVHAAGVLHRDIKAGNVILRAPDQEPVLTDFGLAVLEGDERLTRSGDLLGTPLYMSPEQLLGRRHELDAQADVWGLGVLLYHALTGAHPFPARSLSELARMVHHEDMVPLAAHLGRDDPALTRVLGRALAKRKLARYRSAAEMAADLAVWPALPGPPPAPPPPPPAIRWALAGLAGLALVLAVAVIVVLVRRPDPAELERLREASRALAFDPGGVQPAPAAPRLQALEAALSAAARHPPAALAEARALQQALAADAALRAGELEQAEQALAALPAGPTRTLLQARLTGSRGGALDRAGLEALIAGDDPASATAARVLLARARMAEDPPAAAKLLQEVDPALIGPEQRQLWLLAQLEAADAVTVKRLAAGAAPSELALLQARARRLLAHSLELEPPDLELAQRRLLVLSGLALPTTPDALADRVLELLGERTPQHDLVRSPDTRLGLLEALAASGLRPLQRGPADRLLDDEAMEALPLDGRPPPLARYARVLVACVRMDVDIIPSHFAPIGAFAQPRWPAGWEGEYLQLLVMASHGEDEVEERGKRELHKALTEGRFPLGPIHRARAIRESVHAAMGWEAVLAALREARSLDPENPWVLMQLAVTHQVGNQRAEALRACDEALALLEKQYAGRAMMRLSQERMLLKEGVELLLKEGELGRARELIAHFGALGADVADARGELEKAERRLRR